MKSFLKTFYGKLSLVFLFLLILLGSAQIFITIQSSMRFMSETDQKLNLPLAQNMAAELRPFCAAANCGWLPRRATKSVSMSPPMCQLFFML